MKRAIKFTFLIIISIIILFLGLFVSSYLFPGRITYADKIRVKAQTAILKHLGNAHITDYSRYEYGEEEMLHLINYEELSKYVVDLETGDFFFTESENYLSSQVTPGRWKHSIIYIGTKEELTSMFDEKDKVYQVIEPFYQHPEDILILDGSEDGVLVRNLDKLSNVEEYSYLKSVVAFKVKLSMENREKYLEYALEQIGKEYDYDMDTEDKNSLYCSELLFHSLNEVGVSVDNITNMLARSAVSPTDLVNYFSEDDRFETLFCITKKDGQIIEEEKK